MWPKMVTIPEQAQSISSPWKTIQKAASVLVAGDTCYVRGGTYRETVTPTNSGTSSNSVTFMNYNNETVTVSGADVVTGWTQHSGNIYKATTNMSLGTSYNQVFVNGTMYDLSRWPNNTGTVMQYTTATADSGTMNTIIDAELTQADNYWVGAKVWIRSGPGWYAEVRTVTAFNSTTHTLTLDGNLISGPPIAGNKYYLSGVLQALDTEKEFHYDSTTSTLYLWKEGGGSPSTVTVESKKRYYGFDLSNRSYINIKGINLFATGIKTAGTSSNCTIDGITASYVMHGPHHFELSSCDNPDGGILLIGVGHTLKNSTIQYASEANVTAIGSNINVVNNIICSGGYGANSDPLLNIGGSNILVSNNDIYEAGRACMGIQSGSNMQIQYNNIYNAGLNSSDLGIIYSGNLDGGNSRIHHNKIHDNLATHLPLGLYFDNFTQNWVIDHNVIWGCTDSIRLNTSSENMLVYNNTLVGTSKAINYWGNRYEKDMSGTRVFNNIFRTPFAITGGVVEGNNLYSNIDPLFYYPNSGDYRLTPSSPAKDIGIAIPGITDDVWDGKPDIGAYEYYGTSWNVGHNFSSPPTPTITTTNTPFMNFVKNAGFEKGVLAEWSLSYGNYYITNQNAWGNPDSENRTNYYGQPPKTSWRNTENMI